MCDVFSPVRGTSAGSGRQSSSRTANTSAQGNCLCSKSAACTAGCNCLMPRCTCYRRAPSWPALHASLYSHHGSGTLMWYGQHISWKATAHFWPLAVQLSVADAVDAWLQQRRRLTATVADICHLTGGQVSHYQIEAVVSLPMRLAPKLCNYSYNAALACRVHSPQHAPAGRLLLHTHSATDLQSGTPLAGRRASGRSSLRRS